MNEENKKTEIEYILSQRKKGGSDEAIKQELLEAGWTEEDIAIGFAEIAGGDMPAEREKQPDIKAEKKDIATPSIPPVPDKSYKVAQTKVISSDEVMNPVVKMPDRTGESAIKTTVAIIIGLLILGGVSAAVYFLFGVGKD